MSEGATELTFEGLRLELAPGLYWLPAHVFDVDITRLLAALAAGLQGVRELRRASWSELIDLAPGALPEGSLLYAQAPTKLAAGEIEGLELGPRRWLLLRRAELGPELDEPWAERRLKAPIGAWLRRWARAVENPLVDLNIAQLPVATLSAATTDPGELLTLAEASIAHRRRHAPHGGHDAEAWERSVRWALAQRLNARLERVEAALVPKCVEVLLSSTSGELRTSGAVDWARALAEAGLAWRSGDDLLLVPLARAAHARELASRLVYFLPAKAWSPRARARLDRMLDRDAARLRAALACPELPYHRHRLRPQVLEEVRFVLDENGDSSTDPVADFLDSLLGQWRQGRFRDPALQALLCEAPPPPLGLVHDEMALSPRARSAAQLAHRILERAAALCELLDAGEFERIAPMPREDSSDPGLAAIERYFWLLELEWLDPNELPQRALQALTDSLGELRGASSDPGLGLLAGVMRGDLLAFGRDYEGALAAWEAALDLFEDIPPELSARLLFARFRTEVADFSWGALDLPEAGPLTSFLRLASHSLWEQLDSGEALDADETSEASGVWIARQVEALELWRLELARRPCSTDAVGRAELTSALALAWSCAWLGLVDEAREQLARLRPSLERLADPLLVVLVLRVEVAAQRAAGESKKALVKLRELQEREDALGLGDGLACATELHLAAAEPNRQESESLRVRLSRANRGGRLGASLRHELARLLEFGREPRWLDVASFLAADDEQLPLVAVEPADDPLDHES